jgi:yecA family protein
VNDEDEFFAPLLEEEEAELMEFLESFPEKGVSLAKLHGFYTAFAAGPLLVDEAELLGLTGIAFGKLPIKDTEHGRRISSLLGRFYSEIVNDLASESFVPRLQPKDVVVAEVVSDIVSWCQGFVLGLQQELSAWRSWFKDPRRAKAISLIIGTAETGERLDTADPEAAAWRAHSMISDLIPLIASYWRFESALDELGGPQPTVAEPRIGRNRPCPCGSGKKYKHCCGKVG